MLRLADPCVVTGFNDFKYDWPFVQQRLKFFGLSSHFQRTASPRFQPEAGAKPLFRSMEIKINASDKKPGICLQLPGIICADTRYLLIKSQKLEKKSLNDYL